VGYAIELNTETEFVAKTPQFIAYAERLLDIAVQTRASDRVQLLEAKGETESVKEIIDSAAALFKENIKLGQVGRVEGEEVNLYAHKKSAEFPPSIVALVATDEAGSEIAHDVALQVSAMSPFWLSEEDVPADVVESESRIAEGKARQEGKPEGIIGKIVQGRIKSFYEETVLLDQKYVKDPSKTIGQLAKEAGGAITSFLRIEVGKGEEESRQEAEE
ncbi:MAG: translation elongation factor Ts, partial [Aeriscardovia sp.]|nr:translation elongation factor Ts [Aeriscardovia sp.]